MFNQALGSKVSPRDHQMPKKSQKCQDQSIQWLQEPEERKF
jgi:hypothetical protein